MEVREVAAECYKVRRPCLLHSIRPVVAVVKDIAISAGGFGFDSWAGQFGHKVVNGSSPQLPFFGAVLPKFSRGDGPPHLVHSSA